MSNAGIDYGLGKTNIDTKTGIRFGVIQANHVGQAWYEDSEAHYSFHCPHCGGGPLKKGSDAKRCPHCYKVIDSDRDFDNLDPDFFFYKKEGYKCFQKGEDPDIFVEKSPYFTYAQFCSPCAPGACSMESELDEPLPSNKCYCLGHDWFEDGKAPYTVYSVKTGKVVEPQLTA